MMKLSRYYFCFVALLGLVSCANPQEGQWRDAAHEPLDRAQQAAEQVENRVVEQNQAIQVMEAVGKDDMP